MVGVKIKDAPMPAERKELLTSDGSYLNLPLLPHIKLCFLGKYPCIYPSLRLGLESRLRLGLNIGEGCT